VVGTPFLNFKVRAVELTWLMIKSDAEVGIAASEWVSKWMDKRIRDLI
jgi:hypothetical protein